MSENKALINEALRLLRLYAGLSQKQMAEELGISQSMISDLERGTKSATLEVLERYSDATNVRMSQLLFFAEEIAGEPPQKRGRPFIAGRVLALLESLAPKEVGDDGEHAKVGAG